MKALGWQVSKEFAAYYYTVLKEIDKASLYLKTARYQGAAAVAGRQLAILNHLSLAVSLEQKKSGQSELPGVFGIMPDKYKGLADYEEQCYKDADGRAALRLVKLGKQLEDDE